MRRYYRRIIFTKTPLKTQYNYKNVFQILPINSEFAPTNPFAGDFPLFLEYYIDFEDNEAIKKIDIYKEYELQQKKEFEIVNLLSVLTNHRFFKYQTNKNAWSIMSPNIGFDNLNEEKKKLYNNQYSSWGIVGYMYPELKDELEINDFSEQKFTKTSLISPYYQYFTDNPIENKCGEITFPEFITDCLDSYYDLPDKILHKVKSCIYLTCDGIDISDIKRSLSFLSFISAIEGLVALEASEEEITFECKSCKSIRNSPYHCTTDRKSVV